MKRSSLAIGLLLSLASPIFAGPVLTDIAEPAGVGDAGNSRGVAFADVDNDGDWDLYVSNQGGGNHLYRSNGDGSFVDATAEMGDNLGDTGFCGGSVFFDYDNDGWMDLYIPKGGRYEIGANRLLHNDHGSFVDVTERAGLGSKAFTYAAAAADYDNDGHLDLYLANYGVAARNQLLRNSGNGTFADVTKDAGVGDPSWSRMAIWADVNDDGLPDLYVVNGRYPAGEPNTLYMNNGDGTFTNASRESGLADANWGIGAAFADVDTDGDLDVFVSNYAGPSVLYLNDGRGRFTEATEDSGLAGASRGTGPAFGDLDNDGDPDLYEGSAKGANQLYLSDGGGNFTDVAGDDTALRCATSRTEGTSFADVDGDGDLDLYVANRGQANRLFQNQTNGRNWLKVRLVGTLSNRMAVGARVWVRDGPVLRGLAELQTATGFCAQSPQELHFGLDATRTYTVEVRFPSGARRVVESVRPGEILLVEEPRELAER